MWLKLTVVAVAFLALGSAGCKDRSSKPAPPAASQVVKVPASEPTSRATSGPVVSYLVVNDAILEFPRARLRIKHKEPTLTLLLSSDDPRQAIEPGYTGNSYHLDMTLDVSDRKQIGSSVWKYKAANLNRQDTFDGIFLEGNKRTLQPYDVTVSFEQVGQQITLTVSGQFVEFDQGREGASAPLVFAHGTLTATLESR